MHLWIQFSKSFLINISSWCRDTDVRIKSCESVKCDNNERDNKKIYSNNIYLNEVYNDETYHERVDWYTAKCNKINCLLNLWLILFHFCLIFFMHCLSLLRFYFRLICFIHFKFSKWFLCILFFNRDKSITANSNNIVNSKWHYSESCDNILDEIKSKQQWHSLYIYMNSEMMHDCEWVIDNICCYIYFDLNIMHDCERSKSEMFLLLWFKWDTIYTKRNIIYIFNSQTQ